MSEETERLRNLLIKHGVCEDCGEMYSHDIDGPFASCKCKQSEWYKFTPYMELQYKFYGIDLSKDYVKQTKIESIIEQTANYSSGFIIAWMTWEYIALPMVKWMNDSPYTGLAVTSLFTAISFARSYYWRRFFNARLHKVVHKFVTNLIRRK